MENKRYNPYSQIPKVDEVLTMDAITSLEAPYKVVVEAVRDELESVRENIRLASDDERKDMVIDKHRIVEGILSRIRHDMAPRLRRVVNGTGVVVHTNLGRSLLHPSVMQQLNDISCGYSNLEFKIMEGTRGSRYDHVEELLCRLTGAEAAMVVNNNAAAVLLVLSTLAKGKEVVVSRGQLVEIGGAFRVPDVMRQSGCELVEVGTTNKTHLRDYEMACGDDTALILKVHTSNYRILGFTKEVPSAELSTFAKSRGIPFVEDIGSGSLVDLTPFGLTKEPTVRESIESGIDVVTFSGDKMLGGPQAGIIVGRKTYIDQMKKNQLTRALRVDKMTFAALEGTLRMYLDENQAVKEIPTLRMLTMSYEEIKQDAQVLSEMIREEFSDLSVRLLDGYSEVGGGSLPLEQLHTCLIGIRHQSISTARIATRMRGADMPVVVRISDEEILIDCRTIQKGENSFVLDAIGYAVK